MALIDDDGQYAAQAEVIQDLANRIGEALSYIDWLSTSTDIDEAILEQLLKILEGEETEH